MTRGIAALGTLVGVALIGARVARRRGYVVEISVHRAVPLYEAPDIGVLQTADARLIDEVRAELDEVSEWPTMDPLPGSELLADDERTDDAVDGDTSTETD